MRVSTCVCVGMCIYVYETVGLTVLECNTRVCGCGTVLKVRLERQRDLDRQADTQSQRDAEIKRHLERQRLQKKAKNYKKEGERSVEMERGERN